MSDNTPPTRSPMGCRSIFRSAVLAIALCPVLGPAVCSGAPDPRSGPPEVTGLAGVTYLTTDLGPLRRFYGRGAGFAEVPAGGDRVRFIVGAGQWIEFQVVHDPNWGRRLQYVTLEAERLGELEGALRTRGISTRRIGSDPGSQVLQLEDPAGNTIQFAAPWIAPPTLHETATPFSRHLQHFGLAVDRLRAEATMAFYREELGWPEVARGTGPDGRLAMVKYRLPGRRNELIELIFYDPPLNKWAAGAFDHVNFEVNDIDTAYRALFLGGIATTDRSLPTVNAEHLWAIDIIDPDLTRMEIQVLKPTQSPVGTVSTVRAEAHKPLFDGRKLAGWEGNTGNWRIEGDAIVAGALDRLQPHNEFLATTSEYGDFDMRLQYKVEGTGGFVNGGVQFWSERVPDNFEVSGYQADLGANTDGNLYDESRRNRNLATPSDDARQHALRPNAWNDYRIRAEGAHIQIWLNGVKTVDYTEGDAGIPRRGRFALQIHGGAKTKVSYRILSIDTPPGRAE
jgi:catechol 2,3-dioxygenase-like lactoylglutathione lyase family enzyme